MNTRKEIQLVGTRRSRPSSSFTVFEYFKNWTDIRQEKVLPVGCYFIVATVAKKMVELRPDLFIQGYRPHSSCPVFSISKRRYGAFVRVGLASEKIADDDVSFYQAQLYKVMGENDVELILKDGESHDRVKIQHVVSRICRDEKLETFGSLKRYLYSPKESILYFLAGRTYSVWSIVVGQSQGLSGIVKKVLVFDYETGIPALVPYDESCFKSFPENL